MVYRRRFMIHDCGFFKGTRRWGDYKPVLQHNGNAERARKLKQSSLIFGRCGKVGTVRQRRPGVTRRRRRPMLRWATRAMSNLNSSFESTKTKGGKR